MLRRSTDMRALIVGVPGLRLTSIVALLVSGLIYACPAHSAVSPVAHERVPRAARVLKISWWQAGRHRVVVTNVTKVRRVAGVVDALPLNGPGICSEGFLPPNISFSFRASVNGPVLARALGVLNPFPGAFCMPTPFWVRGHGTQLLVEDSSLLVAAHRILGISPPNSSFWYARRL
jgi:hypothetical protein